MLDSIKRWLGTASTDTQGWGDQAAWAQAHQWTLRGVRDIEGFVIDGRCGATPWRLEWGPSQRPYIQGQELRLRAELSVPRELQALVLNRELMESMEKAVFDQYVEGVQTRIDTTTPPEMRWLVMFPKLSGAELKALARRLWRAGELQALDAAVAERRACAGAGGAAHRGRAPAGADDRTPPPEPAHRSAERRRHPYGSLGAPVRVRAAGSAARGDRRRRPGHPEHPAEHVPGIEPARRGQRT